MFGLKKKIVAKATIRLFANDSEGSLTCFSLIKSRSSTFIIYCYLFSFYDDNFAEISVLTLLAVSRASNFKEYFKF